MRYLNVLCLHGPSVFVYAQGEHNIYAHNGPTNLTNSNEMTCTPFGTCEPCPEAAVRLPLLPRLLYSTCSTAQPTLLSAFRQSTTHALLSTTLTVPRLPCYTTAAISSCGRAASLACVWTRYCPRIPRLWRILRMSGGVCSGQRVFGGLEGETRQHRSANGTARAYMGQIEFNNSVCDRASAQVWVTQAYIGSNSAEALTPDIFDTSG